MSRRAPRSAGESIRELAERIAPASTLGAVQRVWSQAVGEAFAPHARPTAEAGGTLTVLSTSSITVHNNEHGDVSCTLGPASPRLGDFHVGDHVGMACVDGVLAQLVKL